MKLASSSPRAAVALADRALCSLWALVTSLLLAATIGTYLAAGAVRYGYHGFYLLMAGPSTEPELTTAELHELVDAIVHTAGQLAVATAATFVAGALVARLLPPGPAHTDTQGA
jgi:hypothetical protein